MRNLLLLTSVFFFTITVTTAQNNTRPGVQPAAAAASTAAGRSSAATRTPKTEVRKTETVDVTKSRSGNEPAKSREKSPVVAKSTKTPTIPANTNTRTTPRTTTAKNADLKTPTVKAVAAPFAIIKWMTIEEAMEKSKTEKRKIFVDVYTDWCGWCKHMDSTTFKDQSVVNYINEKYYPVKFNAEQASEITYKDKVYKFVKQQGGKGYHELAALWLNNRLSYPTSVVLNEDQDLIQPIPGYQDTKKMDAILHYFGTDSHRKTPWEKYEKNYAKEK